MNSQTLHTFLWRISVLRLRDGKKGDALPIPIPKLKPREGDFKRITLRD